MALTQIGGETYLPRAAAGGGPSAERSEERMVEGASLTLGGSIALFLALRMGLAPSTTRSSAGGPPPAALRRR
jgi:hypothetical protein